MSTQSQIDANRENAKLSCGPITAEGKAAVSQNRLIHGLNYHQGGSFRVLPCEDQADYDRLCARLQGVHEPEDLTETLLVIAMAQHRWLFDRASYLQETCFDPDTAQITHQKLFALYLRYATTHERAFHRCLNDLLKLKAERKKSKIGFESQKRLAATHQMQVDLHEMKLIHEEGRINRQKATNSELRPSSRSRSRPKPPLKRPETRCKTKACTRTAPYDVSAPHQQWCILAAI